MEALIEAVRDAVETSFSGENMYSRLKGLALDFKGHFQDRPLVPGVGRNVTMMKDLSATNSNITVDGADEAVVLSSGFVVCHVYPPTAVDKLNTVDLKVGIGTYARQGCHDGSLYLSDVIYHHVTLNDARSLLAFF